MPLALTFSGDQVASFASIDLDANMNTVVSTPTTPFLPTDQVIMTITDASYNATTGEFAPEGPITILSVQVIRDGVTYTLATNTGAKIKESGNGNNKEQGDSFFVTNDKIGNGPPGSPFAALGEHQYVFSINSIFVAGQSTTLQRLTNFDFNNDGDFHDPGETGNRNFNVQFTTICFARGSLIKTPSGEKRVEDLAVGDLVCTLDHGIQPVSWTGSQKILAPRPNICPVRIAKDALAPGLPHEDLVVSRQHRIYFSGSLCSLMFGAPEVLVAAEELCNDASIRVQIDAPEVEYFHVMFERHEIIWSNGLLTESFFPGGRAMRLVDAKTRTEILELFPVLGRAKKKPMVARTVLKSHEAALLAPHLRH